MMQRVIGCVVVMWGSAGSLVANETRTVIADSPTVVRALDDELRRSMTLQVEDLEKPYFIAYTVDDVMTLSMRAANGALLDTEQSRGRRLYTALRVGDLNLDNTNFADPSQRFFGGGDGPVSLPIDDDYAAIRQTVWWSTDATYKQAVETLTRKKAYLRDKNITDRPADYTPPSPTTHSGELATLTVDRAAAERRLQHLSGQFNRHAQIQESSAQLLAAAGNTYIVDSAGTRLRHPEQVALLWINAELQAEDGMRLSSGLMYFARTVAGLPDDARITADIDDVVARLTAAAAAPVLDHYAGPVMFEGVAAGQLLRAILSEGLAGRPEPVGSQRRRRGAASSLENKINQRILPDGFDIHDDATVASFEGQALMGHYAFDGEGTAPQRLSLVRDGKLQALVLGRTPLRRLSGTTGHGRVVPGTGVVQAAVGSLFVESAAPVEDLKQQLIDAARDAGLEYGLLIRSIRSTGIGSSRTDMMALFRSMQSGRSDVGDPVMVFKVHVDDGREEPVRGIEFGGLKLRDLKDIIGASRTRTVYNYVGIGMGGGTPATSIVTPSLLFEELELNRIEQELDTRPLLPAPQGR